MDFGKALDAIKKGKKASRTGWNGKEQYIELVCNVSCINPDGHIINLENKDSGNKAIAFIGTRGLQIGWLASQEDMLSDDWIIRD